MRRTSFLSTLFLPARTDIMKNADAAMVRYIASYRRVMQAHEEFEDWKKFTYRNRWQETGEVESYFGDQTYHITKADYKTCVALYNRLEVAHWKSNSAMQLTKCYFGIDAVRKYEITMTHLVEQASKEMINSHEANGFAFHFFNPTPRDRASAHHDQMHAEMKQDVFGL